MSGSGTRSNLSMLFVIPKITMVMKSTKVQTLGGIWRKYWNIWIENTFARICIRCTH